MQTLVYKASGLSTTPRQLLLRRYQTLFTVKPVLSGHLKIDKTKVLMVNGNLMKVKSIAECSLWSILQYFWPVLSKNRS